MAARKTATKKGEQSKRKGPGKTASKGKPARKDSPDGPPVFDEGAAAKKPGVSTQVAPRRRDRLAGGGARERGRAAKREETSLEDASDPGVAAALPSFGNH